MVIAKEEIEKLNRYRFTETELAQVMKGVGNFRLKTESRQQIFEDIPIYFKNRYKDQDQAEQKGKIFSAILVFIQKNGYSLARADYIRSDKENLSFHEDLVKALIDSDFVSDDKKIRLDESKILSKLGLG